MEPHTGKPVCHQIYYGNHNGIFGRDMTMYKTFSYTKTVLYGGNVEYLWRLRLNKIFSV